MTKHQILTWSSARLALSITAVAILLPGCGDSVAPPDSPDPPAATDEVDVVDNRFTPPDNSIDIGQTVTWNWGGAHPHNVTFDDPEIGNSVTQVQGSFEKTFDEAGEFTYFCTVHGRAVMSGSVVVGG